MFWRIRAALVAFVSVCAAVGWPGVEAGAQEAVRSDWQVVKSTGDVWLTTSDVQQVSLGGAETLKSGDAIRTGRTGRVLLARGSETILIAPNSIVSLPTDAKEGSATTILQQAGSILLEVDKRNVKNFEVETPYLVAAVKGTQFRVSVNRDNAAVQVHRGEVEVADFKTGQLALVQPGQMAKVATQGTGGLTLSGSGVLSPIRHGEPRSPLVQPAHVPRAGLPAPQGGKGQQVYALAASNRAGFAQGHPGQGRGVHTLRIAVPLGEMKLDVHKATNGLAHSTSTSSSPGGRATQPTLWTSGALTPGNGLGAQYNTGNNGSGNGSANGGSGGNGNAGGNGNGNANGNSGGNGNALGLLNGNGGGNGSGPGNNPGNGPPNGHPPHPPHP